jgi:hypothetical protein
MWDLLGYPARSPKRLLVTADCERYSHRFAVTTPGVFLYHPGRRQVLPKLRAFIDHVKGYSGTPLKTSRGTLATALKSS